MPRLLAAVLLAALVAVAPAPASKAIDITPDYVSGAHLGWTQAQYRKLLGPLTVEHLELGYTRLTTRTKVQVYLEGGRGVAIATWNRHSVDGSGITPCSSVASLKAAYGAKLKPARLGGKLRGYRLDRLLYATGGTGRVRVIMLAGSGVQDFLAYNSTQCTGT